jgi:catechol 2,3-dioxygenase-like lactoylglutathione lyase family enzyme
VAAHLRLLRRRRDVPRRDPPIRRPPRGPGWTPPPSKSRGCSTSSPFSCRGRRRAVVPTGLSASSSGSTCPMMEAPAPAPAPNVDRRTAMTLSISHFGICVSDLDRSLRFYCDGTRIRAGGITSGRRGVRAPHGGGGGGVESRMLRRDGITIELLGFISPGVHRRRAAPPHEPAGPHPPVAPGRRCGSGCRRHRGSCGGTVVVRYPDHTRPVREPGSTSSTARIPTASVSS